MTKTIAVVDLGHFKAYRISKNKNESARVELIDSYDIPETHGKIAEKFTDLEGRFRRGEAKGVTAAGSGEPHNVETEIEKKVIRQIANAIKEIIAKERSPKWYLAAAEEINNQIVDNLEPSVRSKLAKNVKANLTKIDKSKILGYFEEVRV